MKVLIFTHKSDIDGMGGAVLANLAFNDVTYILTETFKLQETMQPFFDNEKIYQYDRIYITDLWLEEPMLTKVAKDDKLKDKIFIFDHHESALTEGFNKYNFTTIKISDEKGLCSGTSLFYEYLISESLLNEKEGIKKFVELTRQYDTWEWVTKYNNEEAHELTLLFDILGGDNYIKSMTSKLKENSDFKFNEIEKMLINNKKEQTQNKIEEYIKKMIKKEINGYKAGIIFIDYEYRNDIAEVLRKKNVDIDFVMLIVLEYGTISHRSIKPEVNVRLIAESFGGKGHDKAASSPIREKVIDEVLNTLLKSN